MVCSHFMPRIVHISSITLLMKLAPLSLKSLARVPKIEMYPPYKKFGNRFCSLIRGHVCQHVLHEVVLEHQDVGDSR